MHHLATQISRHIEALESRIAPATITPTLVTYTDLDGDHVKVTCSKPVLAELGALVFTSPDGGLHEQLQLLHLGADAAGAKLVITATAATGGTGDGFVNVGAIDATGVNLSSVTVKGDLGQIDAGRNDATILALGSLGVGSLGRLGVSTQGATPDLTSTFSGNVGTVKITGDVKAASVAVSGSIKSVTITGSLIGGLGLTADHTGEITGATGIGSVKIGGSIVGGDGINSGRVGSSGPLLGGVFVGGSVIGGEGVHSGEIHSTGKMGIVTIKGDLRGGTGKTTGRVDSNSSMAGISIGGSVIGTKHDDTGEIMVTKNIGVVKITGDLRGGGADGTIATSSIVNTGFITADHISSILIGGSLIAGTNDSSGALMNSAAIRTSDDIGTVKILGSLVGNTSAMTGKTTRVVISGEDNSFHDATPTSDLAIKSISISGRVELAIIEAGYDSTGAAVDGDAKIGSITVLGDWIASSVVAGIQSTNEFFGETDGSDTVIADPPLKVFPTNFSRIASITIAGQVYGTVGGSDSYAFEAQQIGAIKIGGVALPLRTGILDNFTISTSTGSDVRVREFA